MEAIAVADYGDMELPLSSASRRWLVFFVCLSVSGLLAYRAIRMGLAAQRIGSSTFRGMERAVELEPGNAEYWDRLGRFLQLDYEQANSSGAIRYFEQAVQIDPRSARYWMDLSAAYEVVGDITRARQSFEKAQEAYPASPEVEWGYGNFLLRQGEIQDGFARIHQAVEEDPKLLPLAISRSWGAAEDVNQLLDRVLPQSEEAYFQTLDFFASIQAVEPGLLVWKRLLALGESIPLPRSFPFLDELIRQERTADAKNIWQELTAQAGSTVAETPDHSVVWDGDFSQDLTNGGFGWRFSPTLGTEIGFDATSYHSPPRSLRLDFIGASNLDLAQPSEFVPVEPSRVYHFRAFLRTESISTESGIRFEVTDPHHHAYGELLTPDLTGTNPWTPVEGQVATGPETHILVISLRRRPSRLFDNRLSGTVWVDDVSLTPAGVPAETATP